MHSTIATTIPYIYYIHLDVGDVLYPCITSIYYVYSLPDSLDFVFVEVWRARSYILGLLSKWAIAKKL